MLKFTIKPHDVLYFGSGKPFNKGGDATSIFPPFPHTFASAIYAKFYSETKIAIFENQGIYKAIYGPFIKKDKTILFPCPVDIMKEKKKENGNITRANLKLKKDFELINIVDTDLQDKIKAILWVKSENEENQFEPFKGFITIDGLRKWYNNERITINDLITNENIFLIESRISINLEDKTRTVKEEDGVYTVNFIRLKEDVSFVFWIDANFDDNSLLKFNKINDDNKLKEIFEKNQKILKIGGESKTAYYEVEIDEFYSLFKDFNLSNKNNNTLILFLTPGIFQSNSFDNNVLNFFSNKILNGGAIGGYIVDSISSRYYKKYSNKTVRAIKPGSLVYFENYKINNLIDFFQYNDQFIGSNLILAKYI